MRLESPDIKTNMAPSAAAVQDFIVKLQADQRNMYSYGKLFGLFTSRFAYLMTGAALTFSAYDILLSSDQEVSVSKIMRFLFSS